MSTVNRPRPGAGRFVAVAVLAVAVGLIFVTGQKVFSPGPLNAQASQTSLGGVTSHAELGCAACHAAPWSSDTMADRCLKCHTDVAAELQAQGTVHYMAVMSDSTVTCRKGCHTEHKGAAASLVLTGAEHEDPKGFSLKAHKTKTDGEIFKCLDCHTQSVDKFDVAVCLECHRTIDAVFGQKHLDAFGTQCLQCHDGIDTYGKAFDHNGVAFKLEGKHAGADCAACHTNARSIAQLKAAPQNCYACHRKDDKHQGTYSQDCSLCHNTVDWAQITVDHSKTSFPLTGKHVGLDCKQCHGDTYFDTPTACYACHQKDDKHVGTYGTNCAQCHNTSDWTQATIDHSKTSYPLTGKHVTVACAACHLNNDYKGIPTACYACHQSADKHLGAYGTNCAQCHDTTDWGHAQIDHSKTAYPLTGKHLTVACNACHINSVFKGTPTTCYACHKANDTHAGVLGQNCAECHNTNGWTPATYNRTHTFPINHGAPRGTTNSCKLCHTTSLLKYTCYGCHTHTVSNILSRHRNTQNLDDCIRCHPTGRGD